MRPLVIVLISFTLSAVASASAGEPLAKTDGATYLQLQDGHGFSSTRIRGTFIGRVRRGRIVATANVMASGCEKRKRLGDNLRLCRGRDVTFLTPAGERWRVRLRGHGIFASGRVRGCLRLDGRDSGPTGTFKIGSPWSDDRPWPRQRRAYKLGSGKC